MRGRHFRIRPLERKIVAIERIDHNLTSDMPPGHARVVVK